MNIKEQVCTVWQGVALKEMGFKQKSLFVYLSFGDEFCGDEEPQLSKRLTDGLSAPAYTVSELFNIIDSSEIKYRNKLHEHCRLLVSTGSYSALYDAFQLAELIILLSENQNVATPPYISR